MGKKRRSKLREKIGMYDMMVANLLSGKAIIEPTVELDSSEIAVGFNNISSKNQISKYFIIRQMPDYVRTTMFDEIRSRCIRRGVKINFFIYAKPYRINWESAEMRNKVAIWKRYSEETRSSANVFEYRVKRRDLIARERIIMSTKYLNEAELDHRRSMVRAAFVVQISALREDEAILNMINTIKSFKSICNKMDIKVKEIRINMIDWMRTLSIYSLNKIKQIDNKLSRKLMTDDILANFNGYKQGRIGKTGVPLGIDVLSKEAVLYKFKSDPEAAENWLISAETGGGKSFFIKNLLLYLIADGFVVTVMDYEGDEYTNIAGYIKAGNTDDAVVVSMGKGSTIYIDPTPIPDLTGDPDIDDDLKETAISYIMAHFRIIVDGNEGRLTQWEESVISTAIQRAYESFGVTDDKETWHRSKNMSLKTIYEELKALVEAKEFVDYDTDNIKHKAALRVLESSSIYFEEGAAKSGTFKHPISAHDLYKAKFIVFSFGMRGAGSGLMDPKILALKQLSVACVSNQISNYCKYVKKCFNVKVWEEFQRWGKAKGSSDIITNAMTGGRKRGDVNFIITNEITDILDDNNLVAAGIRINIQNWVIGKINDAGVRTKFCEKFGLQECEPALNIIAKANATKEVTVDGKLVGNESRYRNSFCVVLGNNKKAIVKAVAPKYIVNSKLFKVGKA